MFLAIGKKYARLRPEICSLEKCTNWDNLVCLSLYIFWGKCVYCLLFNFWMMKVPNWFFWHNCEFYHNRPSLLVSSYLKGPSKEKWQNRLKRYSIANKRLLFGKFRILDWIILTLHEVFCGFCCHLQTFKYLP